VALLFWLFEDGGQAAGIGAKQIVSQFWPKLSGGDYLLLTILISAIMTIISIIAKAAIEETVKEGFQKELELYKLLLLEKLEDYKRDLLIRDQAAKVAELLALVKSGTNADIRRANQLSWEMSLWLPPELAKAVSKVLSKASNAPSYEQLLLEVRCQLLGLQAADIEQKDIATF
jgi:hypothetical protein